MDFLSHLNWFDYTLLAIVTFSLIIGLLRGMLREFISVLTWIAAILVPVLFSKELAAILNQHIKPAVLSSVLSFILLFFITFIIGTLINYIVASLLGKSGGLWLDRLLGGVFGFVRGCVIALFIVFIGSNTALAKTHWFKESLSAKQLKNVVSWLNKNVMTSIKKETLLASPSKVSQKKPQK